MRLRAEKPRHQEADLHDDEEAKSRPGSKRDCAAGEKVAAATRSRSTLRVTYLLLGLGLVTRFYALSWPRQVVFDELHFGKFVNGYIKGEYFFDIHPPFSKLLIAFAARRSGYDGSQAFEKIGEDYGPSVSLYGLRGLPAAFGALLVPLAHVLALELGCSEEAALMVGGMVLLDGSILVESRLLLTDSMLFFFGLLQILAVLRARSADRHGGSFACWLALTGLAIGAAVSTKHTGLAMMAVCGVESVRSLLETARVCLLSKRARESLPLPLPRPSDRPARRRQAYLAFLQSTHPFRPFFSELGLRFLLLLVLPAFFYVSSFSLHLFQLPHPGPGNRHHDRRFTCTLARVLDAPSSNASYVAGPPTLTQTLANPTPGSGLGAKSEICDTPKADVFCPICADSEPRGWLHSILDLNTRMLKANAKITATHQYGSKWSSWPLNDAPVFYWHGKDLRPGQAAAIYMAGNPFIYLLALCGGLLLACQLLLYTLRALLCRDRPRRGFLGTPHGAREEAPSHAWWLVNGWLLLLGYAFSLLPFALVARVTFLYHYIPALLLAFFAAGLAFDSLTASARRGRLCAVLLLLMAATTLYFAPVYLGLPLQKEPLHERVRRLNHLWTNSTAT